VPPEEPPVEVDAGAVSIIGTLLRMEDRRAIDSGRLSTALHHPNRVVRAHAMRTAGRLRDSALVEPLTDALSDPSPSVRAEAAFALGLIGDTSTTVVQALARVLANRADPDSRSGVEAAAALGRIGSVAAFDALLERVRSMSGNAGHDASGREALLHLWRAPRTRTVLEAVLPHLASTDPEVRWNAAYALARPGGSLSVAALLPLADDGDAGVRALALRVMRAPSADSARLREQVHSILRDRVQDGSVHVRINALNALATFRDTQDVALIARHLTDADGNTRIAAAGALGEIGGNVAARHLADMIVADTVPFGVRATALSALARVDTARAIGVTRDWVATTMWLQRLHAVRTLASLPSSPGTNQLLLSQARDPDPRVAAAALRALIARDTSKRVQSVLVEQLASSDAAVRAAAARGLERNPRAAGMALLMEAYQRARQDSVPEAALAIVDALGALQAEGMPVARAFFLRFPPSHDPRVRERVAERIGFEGWKTSPAPVATEKPDSFYVGVVQSLVLPALTSNTRPHVAIGTPYGEIVVALLPEEAPLTVLNFLTLIRSGYYTGGDYEGEDTPRWHRVVPNFVLQDGDPRGDGTGSPGFTIRDELNRLRYTRGVLGMALSGPDTGGGQFFITHSPQPHLDGGYTIFGRVVSGMEVADRVIQDDAISYIQEVR
jgi:peptidylprolyl isomerase